MLFTFSCLVIVSVMILIAVSFYTLYERKILSLSHIRLGPNIVGYFGLLQPFSDAIKLFSKTYSTPSNSNLLGVMACPILSVTVSLFVWSAVPWLTGFTQAKMMFLIVIISMSVSGMLHLGVGWASNSMYAMVGSLRCLAQGVSYEVSLAVLFLIFALPSLSIDLLWFYVDVPRGLLLIPLSMMWCISCLAESNRSPLDFAEGESELVSGFNVEYSGVYFALLFISEYTNMIFLSLMTTILLLGVSSLGLVTITLIMMHLFVWVRASYPRTRYDKLMMVCWKLILPSILYVVILCLFIML